MDHFLDYREEYTFTLVPERAALFHDWAAWRDCSAHELFLHLLAVGVAYCVHAELGLDAPDLAHACEPDYQEYLLDRLREHINAVAPMAPGGL